ncbi:hypothetical protein B0T20DRAFT_472641 [Sordaria brevicollis]|uniref:Zn(2)-C6 fungal-type domain-containing protein n=1 Tax=Sordaria brevicollis TaxID=83679 RepID=A0AAE0P1Y2_SORBR|nr:hypothetical protein B0T20DRAFT_472641 [Sordaria brevicollis]
MGWMQVAHLLGTLKRQQSLHVSPTEASANASLGVQDPEHPEQGGSPFKEIPNIYPFQTAKVEESKNNALDKSRATDEGKGRETTSPPAAESIPSENMATSPLITYSPFQGHHHGNLDHQQTGYDHSYEQGHQHSHSHTQSPQQHGYAPGSIGGDSDFDQRAWDFVNVSPDTGNLGHLQASPVQGSISGLSSSWTNVEGQPGAGLSPLPAALTPDAFSASPEVAPEYDFTADIAHLLDSEYALENVGFNFVPSPDLQYDPGMIVEGAPQQIAQGLSQQPENVHDGLDLQLALSNPNVPPWDPLSGGFMNVSMEGLHSLLEMDDFNMEAAPGALSSSPPESINSHTLSHQSPPENAQHLSVPVQQPHPAPVVHIPVAGPSSSSHATSKPIAIHKTRGNARVQKKKASPSPPAVTFATTSNAMAVVNFPAESKFVVITPQSISEAAAKGSNAAYGGKDAEGSNRVSLKGRKGPLPPSTAVSALNVRRKGACFCCHARKVKCEETRPCRRCEKLKLTVPDVICWQFSDFTDVIFPGWLKAHLTKEGPKGAEEYVRQNVASFKVRFRKSNGDGADEEEEEAEKPIKLTLTLGRGFNRDAMLTVFAKFFTPTPTATDAIKWFTTRIHPAGKQYGIVIEENPATPIALPQGWMDQKEELRRHLRSFHEGLYNEDQWAYLVTQSAEDVTDIPKRVLPILRRFANMSGNSMVKRALMVITMHYAMTYHLHLHPDSVRDIEAAGYRVPQGLDKKQLTARVLNRQLKAVTQDMIEREVRRLFEDFSKALKPRSRKEWAGCFAAFAALSVFLEYREAQADAWVNMENQLKKREWLYKVQQQHYQQQMQQHLQREAENLLGRKEGGVEPFGEPDGQVDELRLEFTRKQAWDVLEAIDNLPFKQFMYQFHQIYQTHPSTAKDGKAFNPFVDDEALESLREFPDGDAAIYMVRTFRDRFFDVDDTRRELDFLTFDPSPPKENVDPLSDPGNKNKTTLFSLFTGRLLSKFLLSFIDERMVMGSTGFTGGNGGGSGGGSSFASGGGNGGDKKAKKGNKSNKANRADKDVTVSPAVDGTDNQSNSEAETNIVQEVNNDLNNDNNNDDDNNNDGGNDTSPMLSNGSILGPAIHQQPEPADDVEQQPAENDDNDAIEESSMVSPHEEEDDAEPPMTAEEAEVQVLSPSLRRFYDANGNLYPCVWILMHTDPRALLRWGR